MSQGFIAAHLPFWVVTYILALTAWGCLARFAMQFFFAPDHPNYIWRGFRLLTGWAVAAARYAVPMYVLPAMLPLVAACWLFGLRFVFGLFMISAGLAPTLQAPAP
ncbi:MAG: hypothetical protein ACK4PG_02650 [Acetobacteraceae bacterium]